MYLRYIYTLKKKKKDFNLILEVNKVLLSDEYMKYTRSHIVCIALRTFCKVLVDSTSNFEAALHYFLTVFINLCLLV